MSPHGGPLFDRDPHCQKWHGSGTHEQTKSTGTTSSRVTSSIGKNWIAAISLAAEATSPVSSPSSDPAAMTLAVNETLASYALFVKQWDQEGQHDPTKTDSLNGGKIVA
ncbi:unnamed protein product [Cuscuta campestris]|uniref:Uncharacterized protein n=1 Tax=Cuscuta campestris TaxID=132261 RepID=A0A484LKP9_9ASTE|nr:unnamed protein product [Cuscuta campestris]